MLSNRLFWWNIDNYYAICFSERRGRVASFRVDKIHRIRKFEEERIPQPEGFDVTRFCESWFLMFGNREEIVTILCKKSVMRKVFDRFGEGIPISPADDHHFKISQTVMVGTTVFSWVFNYAGKIRIIETEPVIVEFQKLLSSFADLPTNTQGVMKS